MEFNIAGKTKMLENDDITSVFMLFRRRSRTSPIGEIKEWPKMLRHCNSSVLCGASGPKNLGKKNFDPIFILIFPSFFTIFSQF